MPSQPTKARRHVLAPLLAAAVVLCVALSLAVTAAGGSDSEEPVSVPEVRALLDGLPQRATSLGRAQAPHVLVVYADPFCLGCTEFYDAVLPRLIERYVRRGRLRVLMRPVTSPGLPPVALRETFAASMQNRLWDFVLLFDANTETIVDPGRIARAVPGLDAARLERDARSPRVEAAVARAAQRAKDLGAAIPSFYFDPAGNGANDVQRLTLTGDAAETGLRTLERRLETAGRAP